METKLVIGWLSHNMSIIDVKYIPTVLWIGAIFVVIVDIIEMIDKVKQENTRLIKILHPLIIVLEWMMKWLNNKWKKEGKN